MDLTNKCYNFLVRWLNFYIKMGCPFIFSITLWSTYKQSCYCLNCEMRNNRAKSQARRRRSNRKHRLNRRQRRNLKRLENSSLFRPSVNQEEVIFRQEPCQLTASQEKLFLKYPMIVRAKSSALLVVIVLTINITREPKRNRMPGERRRMKRSSWFSKKSGNFMLLRKNRPSSSF